METKPFYKTSEFYVLVLGELGAVVTGIAQVVPGAWAAIAGAVVAGAYAVARGIAKAGVPYTPPTPPSPPAPPMAGGSKHADSVRVSNR